MELSFATQKWYASTSDIRDYGGTGVGWGKPTLSRTQRKQLNGHLSSLCGYQVPHIHHLQLVQMQRTAERGLPGPSRYICHMTVLPGA